MNNTWLNKTYIILERVGEFQVFFSETVSYLAAICFLMAIGMTCLKIWLQAADARQEIIRLFMNFVIYTIMIWLYPIAMKAVLPFAMNMGYGAVFGGGLYEATVDPNAKGTSQSGFYKWVDQNSGNVFTTVETTDSNGSTKVALQFNIVDSKTGYIDLNKSFQFIIAFFRLYWKGVPTVSLFSGGAVFVQAILFIISLLIVLFAYIVVLINYLMCLLDYFALQGFGILMVPLSLWEGTKSYTATLIQSIGKILIKLMVISAIMFLSFMTIVDIMMTIYIADVSGNGLKEIGAQFEVTLTLIFQGVFIYVMTKQTTAISSFLMGQNPSMSFGEFARAAGQMIATGAGGAMAGKAAAGAIGNAKTGLGQVISAGKSGFTTGGIGGLAKSVLATGAKNVGSGLTNAVKSAPGAIKQGMNILASGTGATGALTAEGVGIPNVGGGFGNSNKGNGNTNQSTSSNSKTSSSSGNNSISDIKDNSSDGTNAGSGSTNGNNPTANSSGLNSATDSSNSGESGASSSSASGNNSSSDSTKDEKGKSDKSNTSKGSGSADAITDNWNTGLTGPYGKSDGNSNSFANRMIKAANTNAQSGDYYTRQKASYQGAIGNFAKNFADARAQTTEKGKSRGIVSSFSSAVGKTIGASVRGNIANMQNYNGGSITYDYNGNSNKTYALGNSAERTDSKGNIDEKGKFKQKYQNIALHGNGIEKLKKTDQKPKDSDAVNIVNELNEKMGGK